MQLRDAPYIVFDVETRVLQGLPQKLNELAIGLYHDEMGVAAHAAQNFACECADTRPVLDDNPGLLPIDRFEYLVHQEL